MRGKWTTDTGKGWTDHRIPRGGYNLRVDPGAPKAGQERSAQSLALNQAAGLGEGRGLG